MTDNDRGMPVVLGLAALSGGIMVAIVWLVIG